MATYVRSIFTRYLHSPTLIKSPHSPSTTRRNAIARNGLHMIHVATTRNISSTTAKGHVRLQIREIRNKLLIMLLGGFSGLVGKYIYDEKVKKENY
ncbi:4844_t:CDS:2 [Funneliformis geosporum]|uniref:4844_t:CDS:1 n=1 Tax=Funneliformis geosporum TaxID=1117311 RepID=A0A9W4SKI1_9GLOM|nr:4844_t:CDS:2 [Funneliformis geosporum]